MNILYAGDSAVGGAANYLLGVLASLNANVLHLPPSRRLEPALLTRRYDAIVLSDFPKDRVPRRSEQAMVHQVGRGCGFLMVGGWSSFAGPSGGWQGSLIERLLPVSCLRRDDRINVPGGALVVPAATHPILRSHWFAHPPVIGGFNHLQPRSHGTVVLEARALISERQSQGRAYRIRLDRRSHPLLVIDADPHTRVAALATDLAPHWSGGLVDWGTRRVHLPVTRTIRIEVGHLYVEFIRGLLRWLTQLSRGRR